MQFKKIIESWNYKCQRCGADLSITDSKCENCSLDFTQFVITETHKKLNNLLQNLPFPVVYWRIYETLLILIIYLCANLFTNSIQSKMTGLSSEKYLTLTIFLTFFNSLVLFIGTYYLLKRKYKQTLKIVGVKHSANFLFLLFEGVKYSFIFIVFNIISTKYFFDSGIIFPTGQSIFSLLLNSTTNNNLYLTLLFFGIIIPFIEEVFFRGLMFKGFRSKFSFMQAAILTSIIFGILHIEPNMIPISVISGFLFCLLFEKYQNVLPGFIMHSLINMSFIITAYNNGSALKYLSWQSFIVSTGIIAGALLIANRIFQFPFKKKRVLFSGFFNILMIFISVFSFTLYSLINSDQLLKTNSLLSIKALLLINQSKFADAEKLINSALGIKEQPDIELLTILQTIYYYDGEHEKSYQTGKKIIDLLPVENRNIANKKYIDTIKSIALSAAELDIDFSDYFIELKQYLKVNDNPRSDIKETIGWLYIRDNNYKIGEKLMFESFSEQQTFSKLSYSELNYHIGYLYYYKNDTERALTHLKKAAKFDRNNYFAKKSIELLEKLTKDTAI